MNVEWFLEAPAMLARAFEPYVTSKSKGTGLGLAIVHAVTVAHGGTVALDSTPGTGTRVGMTFPLAGRRVDTHQPVPCTDR